MKAIMVMYDSLNLRLLSAYGCDKVKTPNFDRLAGHAVTFDNCYVGSMPCMPARRELHTGRYNFMHRSWGPIEPFDDSMPEILKRNGIYTHLVSDHQHYWEDGGATYHPRYNSWEISRGQEGDTWKGHVAPVDGIHRSGKSSRAMQAAMVRRGLPNMDKQDMVNRAHMATEDKMPQHITFENGLAFIDENHGEDNWFLQIETFDPHEPFFASQRFKEMYPDPDDYTGTEFDWPSYARVSESDELVDHCRRQYYALLSMCDYYLGTVLDAMDKYDLWKDTMLIVNTDHGFLLGEHGWWAKSVMPYYNEIAHIPFFIWDPRSGKCGEKRQALVQNIDVAPTLLAYFGMEATKDMLGHDLAQTVCDDTPVRQYALFGSHGNHINITDGRYVYMRSPLPGTKNYEYTLMPTHMRNRFTTDELQNIELSDAFSFTKGVKLLKIPAGAASTGSSARFGDLLFDLSNDPGQLTPIEDTAIETRMGNEIIRLMKENDAPQELYRRFGYSPEEALTEEKLMAQKKALDSLTMEGLEGMTLAKDTFLALETLLVSMPKGADTQLLGGLKGLCQAKGVTRITMDELRELISSMPIPDDHKVMILNLILG